MKKKAPVLFLGIFQEDASLSHCSVEALYPVLRGHLADLFLRLKSFEC